MAFDSSLRAFNFCGISARQWGWGSPRHSYVISGIPETAQLSDHVYAQGPSACNQCDNVNNRNNRDMDLLLSEDALSNIIKQSKYNLEENLLMCFLF